MLAVTNVFIARTLGVQAQGVVAAATLIPMIVGYAGELGIAVATGYLLNVLPKDRVSIAGTARCLAGVISAILLCITIILLHALPLEPRVRSLGLMFCPFVVLNLFYRLHLSILQADFRVRMFNAVRISGAVTYLCLVALFAIGGFASQWAVVGALLVANLVWCGSAWRAAGVVAPAGIDRGIAKLMLGYGLRAHVGNASALDALRLDQLVLALFLSTSDLGLYVAAMTVVTGNRVIGTSIGAMCFPLATRGKRGTAAGARNHFRKLVAVTMILSVLLAVGEFILGDQLLERIFGSDYRAAGQILRVLAIGSVFMNLRQVYADWLRGCGRPGIVAVSEVAGMISLAVIATVLWNGSVEAVAISVSAASVIACGCLIIAARLFQPSSDSDSLTVNHGPMGGSTA
jgi:O-antigen/teichoic acid export membrane protein